MISLMNHINSDRDNPLFALAFSSEGELYGYLETKTLDVLLMDENISLDESKVPVACRMIFMTRDRVDGSEEISHNRIFKYSRARNISSEILRYMNIDDTDRRRKLFRSYAVISPIGRCGKTNLAVSLCMNDEVRGGLYVGMEEYSAFHDHEDVLANVIYLVKQRSPDLTGYMEQNIVELEEYSVLGYLGSYIDALELDTEDVVWLIDEFRRWGRYTTVVFDMGQAVLKDLEILGAFDEIMVPELKDELSQDKLGMFERVLERRELGKIARRLHRLNVPLAVPGSAEMLRFIESEIGSRR